jgi:O-methyltransferase involved in polyketide biosynthesis
LQAPVAYAVCNDDSRQACNAQAHQRKLAQASIGVPASLTFVPANFGRDDLDNALRQAGFRADQAACVS